MAKKIIAALEDTNACFTPIEANQSDTLANDILWGAQAIADEIGRDVRDTYYLLQQGHVDADKCGDLWVTTKSRLRRQFEGGADRDVKPSAAPSRKRELA